jgi:hypothetical protein
MADSMMRTEMQRVMVRARTLTEARMIQVLFDWVSVTNAMHSMR